MLCGDLNGQKIQKRGDVCVHTAGSLCYTAETNSIVKQLYTNNFFLKLVRLVTSFYKYEVAIIMLDLQLYAQSCQSCHLYYRVREVSRTFIL